MSGKRIVSLYIHIPFCTKKCPYCHFFVLPDSEEGKALLLTGLRKEWELRSPILTNTEIASIYFGGGTPSLLSPKALEVLIRTFSSGPAHLSPTCEITLEVNPETVTTEQIIAFRSAGINRISLGIQSLDDSELLLLGRNHGSNLAIRATESVYEGGIENISVDLMYEIPKQTPASWEATIRRAAKLPITHLSLYNLTFEPGTIFYKQHNSLESMLPDPEQSLSMFNTAIALWESEGLIRYEISAFARKGKISIHNTGYWTGREFLGFGPSAFAYWEGRRFRNISNLRKWRNQIEAGKLPEDFEETLDPVSRQNELLAVGLRMVRGVDLSVFTKTYGPLSSGTEASIANLIRQGFLQKLENVLSLTEKGLLFYDTVAEEII